MFILSFFFKIEQVLAKKGLQQEQSKTACYFKLIKWNDNVTFIFFNFSFYSFLFFVFILLLLIEFNYSKVNKLTDTDCIGMIKFN
jgi:hypothetical protein